MAIFTILGFLACGTAVSGSEIATAKGEPTTTSDATSEGSSEVTSMTVAASELLREQLPGVTSVIVSLEDSDDGLLAFSYSLVDSKGNELGYGFLQRPLEVKDSNEHLIALDLVVEGESLDYKDQINLWEGIDASILADQTAGDGCWWKFAAMAGACGGSVAALAGALAACIGTAGTGCVPAALAAAGAGTACADRAVAWYQCITQ